MRRSNASLHLPVLNQAFRCSFICVCVGWEEVSGGTQCHLKQSAWRHGIRNITPWCQAHFYKHSLNDTQLAAWRQLSLPSLRPHLSLLPLSFPLFALLLTLWRSAGLPPFLLPSGSRLCGAEAAKLTSWSGCLLPFLFVGLPVFQMTLWERLPDAQTAGEIILSLCFCQEFFCISPSVSKSFTLHLGPFLFALLNSSCFCDSPETDHPTEIIQPNDIDSYLLIWKEYLAILHQDVPSPHPGARPPLRQPVEECSGCVGPATSRDWL